MPNVKLMTKAELIRLNNRAIEHGFTNQIDPAICADVMEGILFHIRNAELADTLVTARVTLTPHGNSALLDMTREDYDALAWSRMS
jgi:hypothetical protein